MESNQDENNFEIGVEEKKHYEKDLDREFEDAKKKAIEEANDLFFHLKDWDKTAKIFEDRKQYLNAAFIYQKAGNAKKSKSNFEKAARNFERMELPPKAAYFYEKSGDIRKAAQVLENWYYFFERKKNIAGVGERNFEEYLLKAVSLYLELNESVKAYHTLINGKQYHIAANLLVKLDRLREAAELYKKAKMPLEAATIYEKLGEMKEACLIRGEEALKLDNNSLAAKYYSKAGDFSKAGDLFRKAGEWESAAKCYSEIKNFFAAGECFLKCLKNNEAIEMFEKSGEDESIADLYLNIGDYKKAGEYYQKCGLYYEAGKSFLECNEEKSALINFQKLSRTSAHYFEAVIQIVNIFQKSDQPELVISKLEHFFDEENSFLLDKDRIELCYLLALAYESTGELEKAYNIYIEVCQMDCHYRDAHKKMDELKRLKDKLKLKKFQQQYPSTRFRIISEIGEGGMGTVFKAEDLYLERIVAIKILNEKFRENEVSLNWLHREARAVANLNHPNIVKIYDYGQVNKDHFISMELLEGDNLYTLLNNKKVFTIKEILRILKKILKALTFAHNRGVIHRDIKPHNMILQKDNELKIFDFGIAIMRGQDLLHEETRVSGTPFYMSPEQISNDDVDHRTDIYSTGITLFHLITGEVPFKGTKNTEIFRKHLFLPVPSIKEIRSNIPEKLVEIVEKCMQKEKYDRYESARSILNELKPLESNNKVNGANGIQDSEIPTEILNDLIGDPENIDIQTEEIKTEKINDANIIDDAPTVTSKNINTSVNKEGNDTFDRESETCQREEETIT
jgi:serine/threonine protein kinase